MERLRMTLGRPHGDVVIRAGGGTDRAADRISIEVTGGTEPQAPGG
jgi:hypothetical protein